jgi:hypothetical protein
MPFRGAAAAASATMAATSSAAMGWNRLGGSLTMLPSALEAAMPPRNSRNWVDRMMVRHARGHDQFLLGDLAAEIAVVRTVYCDDGQRDMVPDAGGGLSRKKVAAGRLEEFQHRLVFE